MASKVKSYYRVLMFGPRNYVNGAKVRRVVELYYEKYGKRLVIIEGGAQGADEWARSSALDLAIPVMSFPSPWHHGRRKWAGPVRNQWMIDIGQPHEAVCFHWANPPSTPGSANMFKKLNHAGIKCRVIQ